MANLKKDVNRDLLAEPQEVVLSYRPNAGMEKWFKYRFSAFSEFKAWFVTTLVVLFFYMGGPGAVLDWIVRLCVGKLGAAGAAASIGSMANYFLLGGIGALLSVGALVWGIVYLITPTHIQLTAAGVRLLWRHALGHYASPLISWQSISNIFILRPYQKTTSQDYRICFQYGQDKVLKLKLGAITTTEEREKLFNAIESWAPSVSRDAELFQVLTPQQDHSYTELWLQALSAPPKRERLTPLVEGAPLKEGRYRTVRQLGVGGQGTAYEAVMSNIETGDDETVVLKESILPVYVDINVRRQALEKFQREADILRSLNHPQIVHLLDYFVEDHRSYLVLEHIDGISLRQLVQSEGRLKEDFVWQLMEQMCEILSYLHGLAPPVVHRDFTPDNLILNSNGLLKLIDFTVAQQVQSTATGTVVGKHAYLPPEQFRGKPTCQSDIYAMGATLFYLLTAEDPEPITVSHPIIRRDDITIELDAIVAKATAVDLAERYSSIKALQRELKESAIGHESKRQMQLDVEKHR